MSTIVEISKRVEFDAGHRVPRHESKCHNIHGHRYVVIAHACGPIVEEEDASDQGMLVDFSLLKKWLNEKVHDVFDHGFIAYEGDSAAIAASKLVSEIEGQEQKLIIFPYIPTAENLARWIYDEMQPVLQAHFRENLWLSHIEVLETPTSIARYPSTRESLTGGASLPQVARVMDDSGLKEGRIRVT